MSNIVVIFIIIIVLIVIITIIAYYSKNDDTKASLNFTNLSKTPATLIITDSSTGKILYKRTINANENLTLAHDNSKIDISFTSQTCFDKGINLKCVEHIGNQNHIIDKNYTISDLLSPSDSSCTLERTPRLQEIIINNNSSSSATMNIGTITDNSIPTQLDPQGQIIININDGGQVFIRGLPFSNRLCSLSNINRGCDFEVKPGFVLTADNITNEAQGFIFNGSEAVPEEAFVSFTIEDFGNVILIDGGELCA